MRSTWIRLVVAAGLVAAAAAAAAERGRWRSAEELINVFLAPGHAQWLVGPIALMASAEEVDAYLEITDDAVAERFIERFWSRREPRVDGPGATARQQYEHLAEEADRLYGEQTTRGRHTDRGTIFILYGPPDEIENQPVQPPRRSRFRRPPAGSAQGVVERWLYRGDRVGLDGRPPRRSYRFIRRNDRTRFAEGSEP